MHRCHVPSGRRGPSHLLMTGPPYRQPALAGGAAAISAADIRRAADAPTMQRLMLAPLSPSRQSPTLPRRRMEVHGFHLFVRQRFLSASTAARCVTIEADSILLPRG